MLDGPPVLPAPTLPPTTGKDAHAPATDSEQPPVVWRFEDDQMQHETRAVTGSGSDYEAPFGASVEERYEGTVGVSKDDPAAGWARGRTVYRITWPEADVRTEATLEVISDSEAFHLVVELVAEELGPEPGQTGVPPRTALRAHHRTPPRVRR